MDAAACKMFASEMVGRVADRAVQIYGGAGYIADYGIERFYRDVRLFRLYEGTTQIQQIVIARALMRGEGSIALPKPRLRNRVLSWLGEARSRTNVRRAPRAARWARARSKRGLGRFLGLGGPEERRNDRRGEHAPR